MEIRPTIECLPLHELSVISFVKNILPQNIDLTHLPDDNTCSNTLCTKRTDEETGDTSYQVDSTSFGPDLISHFMQELKRNCTAEQLLTITFMWVMGVISFFYLVLGLELLEKTGHSKAISAIVMFFCKYSLVTITTHFLLQAESSFPFKISIFQKRHLHWLRLALHLVRLLSPVREKQTYIVCIIFDVCMACRGGSIGNRNPGLVVNVGLYLSLQIMAFPIVTRVSLSSELLLFISVYHVARSELEHSVICLVVDKSIKRLLPVALDRINNYFEMLKGKTIGKFLRYAVGLVGTVLFQNFFQLTTFHEVKAFMYLATSWLAILSLSNASEDFGILNFLLGNMILGSTVSQSGLESTTWFTCGVCLLLYVLRLNFKSASSPNLETMRRPPFLFWIFYLCTTFESLYCLVNQI